MDPPSDEYLAKVKNRFFDMFEKFDEDGDCRIDAADLKMMFEDLGRPQTLLELRALVKTVNEKQDGLLTKTEFLDIFVRAVKFQLKPWEPAKAADDVACRIIRDVVKELKEEKAEKERLQKIRLESFLQSETVNNQEEAKAPAKPKRTFEAFHEAVSTPVGSSAPDSQLSLPPPQFPIHMNLPDVMMEPNTSNRDQTISGPNILLWLPGPPSPVYMNLLDVMVEHDVKKDEDAASEWECKKNELRKKRAEFFSMDKEQ